MTSSAYLITTQELSDALESNVDKNLIVLDCSWYLPKQNRNAQAEFANKHIPGARFFDIDAVCDKNTNLPHMLPDEKTFSDAVGSLGIDNKSLVVTYDGAGLFSAARVWWMFHVFGHSNVRVLNGGLPKWLLEDRQTENSVKSLPTRQFDATLCSDLIISLADVLENCESQKANILDARSSGRFEGSEPEPRPELPSGHMPGAISLPFDQLQVDGTLKPPAELSKIFTKLGVDGTKPIITTCGSGVTAAIITLALVEAGLGLQRLYDGGWSEWAAADTNPIISV